MSPPRLARVLGQIEPLGLDASRQRRAGELGSAGLDRAVDDPHRLVDGLTGGALLVDRRQRAELGLQLGELAPLAEQAGAEHGDRVEIAGGGDLGEGGLACCTDVVDHWSPFEATNGRDGISPDGLRRGALTDRRRHSSPVCPGHRNRCTCIGLKDTGGVIRANQFTLPSTSVGLTLAGCLEAQHGRGHGHVEALGASVVPDRHPLVDAGVVGQPACLVADDERDPSGQIGLGVRGPSVRRRADGPHPGRLHGGKRRVEHRHPEQRTGRRAYDLGVERIDRTGGEHHPIDTSGLGRPQDRAEVARVGDPVGDEHEAGRRQVEGGRRDAHHGEDGLRRLGRGDTLDHARRQHERRRAGDRVASRPRRTRPRSPSRRRRPRGRVGCPRRRTRLRRNANCGARAGAAAVGPWRC